MKKHIKKIIVSALLILVLIAAFLYSGTPNTNSDFTDHPSGDTSIEETQTDNPLQPVALQDESEQPSNFPDLESTPAKNDNKQQNSSGTEVAVAKNLCSLQIRCDAILGNMDKLKQEKINIIPKNGVIFEKKDVEFFENESVFDILLRETKNNGIHFEFEMTPAYNSAYIEGISNIYEFDCGQLSGWKYSVNGVSPNHGCSQHKISSGDVIDIFFALDLTK